MIRKFGMWVFGCAMCCAAFTVDARADEDKAMVAFNSGTELFKHDQFAAAAIQFRIAYKHKPTWKLLYNIGQCETGAKRFGLALEAFENYLVESGDDIIIERREEVRKETTRLREMVGSLKVNAPTGAEIFVDGVKRGTIPLSGYLPVTAAREHTVSGMHDGKKMSVQKVKVLTGQVFELTLTVNESESTPAAVPQESAPSDDSPIDESADGETTEALGNLSTETDEETEPSGPADSGAEKLKVLGWVTLGVGAAALAASVGTGLVAMKKDGDLADQCLDGWDDYECVVPYTTENWNLKTQRNRLGAITTGLWIGGGALAATGVVFLILAKKKSKTVSSSLQFAPVVTNRGVGGHLAWEF